ncbi:unnamed protein product [Prunus brigantina]
MEINQVALREGLESEESDARQSAHGSTGSRRSRTDSRRVNQVQESVLRQEENPLITQIAGVPGHEEIQAGQRGEAFPIQEHEAAVQPEGLVPVQRQQNQPEPQNIPQEQPLALLPEPQAGRKRNNPGLEEQEVHREEVLPRPYRAEPLIDYVQPEQGRNLYPINALNDVGALQRMIREMMEPEARRGERPTYRKPYPACIDQIPLPPGFKVPSFTLFNGEDPHASSVEHIGRLFDGMLFGDLAELADKASKYEELLREEQQKRNSSKGTYYKSPIHLVQIESEEETEYSEEGEVAVAEMAKLKHPISCKALTKPPKDQKPPHFTGGFVPNKPIQNKVYSFDLTKVDALFDEMLLQKAIETPHRMPKPEEIKGRQYCRWHNSWNHSTNSCVVFRDVIQEGITAGRLKLAEKAPTVTTDPFPQPQVNMVNLNWPEQKRTSVFDRIGTSSQDRARQGKYPRPAQHNRRTTEQPKKEISIKVPGDDKPLATIIEGRWYSVGKSGRPTMELTRTQKRRVQRQYCIFLNDKNITPILPETKAEAFGAELEGLLQGDLGINMVFILSEKFWATEGQESTLEGDVFSQESFECRLAEAEETSEQQIDSPKAGRTANKTPTEQLCFSKPTKEMANHLRPLFITANFGGVPIPKVMVDGGAAINLLPHRMLSKMGRTEKDLIPTRLTVTNFAGGITKTHGILDVDVIVGSKELKIAFFVLALWNEKGYMEIVEADPRPFLPSAMCFEARYYHDDLGPFTFLGVNQNGRPHGVTAQRLIEDGLASSLEDWNRPFVLKLQNSDV